MNARSKLLAALLTLALAATATAQYNYDRIEVTVHTDKRVYELGEPVVVTVTACNTWFIPLPLQFPTLTRLNYIIDNHFDLADNVQHLPVYNEVMLEPGQFLTQTFTHAGSIADLYPLAPGNHSVVGELLGYDLYSWPDFFFVWPSPKIIYVDRSVGGDGTSWHDAFTHLQDALAIASCGDEIRVAQGTYYPDDGLAQTQDDRLASFNLVNGVALRGGYAGLFGAPIPDHRDLAQYRTILSGDIDRNGLRDQFNSFHVITCDDVDPNTILEGFTITNGHASGEHPHDKGAGLCGDGSPVIRQCFFANNNAVGYGGALLLGAGSPVVSNCAFTGNHAEQGGAICGLKASMSVNNCTITHNTADCAGGVYEYQGSLVVKNSILCDNAPHDYCSAFGMWSPELIYTCEWSPGLVDADGPDNVPGTLDDDLRLLPWSPCINAGQPDGDYADQQDLAGQPRLRYRRVDQGAYETCPIAADLNYDEQINLHDYAAWSQHWLETHCPEPTSCQGADLNHDTTIDLHDLTIFTTQWLQ